MVHDPREFPEQYPNVLNPFWYFDPEQLFNRVRVTNVVQERRAIVEPVSVRDHTIPLMSLGHLFETAVQITDLYVRFDYPFAVQPADDSESSVGSRVRRSDINDRRFGGQAISLVSFPLLLVLDWQLVVARQDRATARLVILAKGVALELLVTKDAPQVRMIPEADPEHVESFTLPPVSGP